MRPNFTFFLCLLVTFAVLSHTQAMLAQTASDSVAQLEHRMLLLEARVHELETEAPDWLQKRDAQLDTTTHRPGLATTEYGPFIVQPISVAKAAGSWRVTLDIGNTTAARFGGAEIYVEWGPPIAEDPTTRDFASAHSKTFKIAQHLLPGRYTRISFLLDAAARTDLRNIQVGVRPLSVALGEPPN
jgi:hypothetical protein